MFSNLHPANSTNILVLIIFSLFLHDDAFRGSIFDALEKICDLVGVYDPVGHEISKFFVSVFVLAEEGMVNRDSEDFCEDVDGMNAVQIFDVAGALEIISDGDFELGSVHALEDEAGSAGDSDKVEFFNARKQLLNP